MKKTRIKVVSMVIIAALIVGAFGPVSVTKATQKADLLISSVREFNEFALSVSNGNEYEGKVVRLTQDIVYDGVTMNNIPYTVGVEEAFLGTFDGAGHTISGIISIGNSDDKKGGLFSVNAGTIQNLILEDCEFSGVVNIGGIARWNSGVIDNCVLKNVTIKSEGANVGGISAVNSERGVVSNCSVSGNIHARSEDALVGGLVGENDGIIVNSCNQASIAGGEYVGGLVGVHTGTIQNCYNVGTVTGGTRSEASLVALGDGESIVANCVAMEELPLSSFGKMEGTNRNNIFMSNAGMQTDQLVNHLNSYRGANEAWSPWEIRQESLYPLQMKKYFITCEELENGTVETDWESTYEGQDVVINPQPTAGYEVESVSVEAISMGNEGTELSCREVNGKYTFTMPASNVVIRAVFAKIPVPIATSTPSTIVPTKETVEPTLNPIGTTNSPEKRQLKKLTKAKVKALKVLKGKKLRVAWKKIKNADGYQLQIATDKKMSRERKTFRINSVKKITKTIKKLKKGKRYYVRVRAYKSNSGSAIYGAWSATQRSKKTF